MKKLLYSVLFGFMFTSCSKKLSPSVHANQYYTKSTSDHSAALQQAINESKGKVFLEAITYNISKTIVLDEGTQIIGDGAKIKFTPSIPQHLFYAKNANSITLENLNIQGYFDTQDDKNYGSLPCDLIKLSNGIKINFKNISISSHAYTALHLTDVIDANIYNCSFKEIGQPTDGGKYPFYSYDAIFIGGYSKSSNIEISYCSFENIGPKQRINSEWPYDGDGIQIQSPKEGIISAVRIENCIFKNCSARGIKMMSGDNSTIAFNKFIGCSTGIGISMANNVAKSQISKNIFDDCRFAWGTNSIQPYNAYEIEFSDNKGNNLENFYRTSGKSKLIDSRISNNVVNNLETFFINGKMENVQIDNNQITNYGMKNDKSLYMAILVVNPSKDISIVGNTISTTANTKTAIYVQDRVQNIQVNDNTLSIRNNEFGDKYIIHGRSIKKSNNKLSVRTNN